MANHPKLIKLTGTFLDNVQRMLDTAPPPKTAKDRATLARAQRTLKKARTTGRKRYLDEELKEARANERAIRARRKKAR